MCIEMYLPSVCVAKIVSVCVCVCECVAKTECLCIVKIEYMCVCLCVRGRDRESAQLIHSSLMLMITWRVINQ